MPPRRAVRGAGRTYPPQRQSPEYESDPSERESEQESVGQNPNSAEYAAQYENEQVPNSPELGEEDSASSNRAEGQPRDPFEQVCQRLIDRLDRRGHPEQRGRSKPSFLDIVATMRTLGTEKYSGGTDPFVADAWMRRLERNLGATRCPEEYKKDVAVYYLDGDAAYWWESLERRYGQYYAAEYSWPQFRSEFLRKYFPVEAHDRMEKQYFELTQRDRSVREYEAEFTRLRRYVRSGYEDEASVARRFLRGLRPDLFSKLQTVSYTDLPTLVEIAVNVEEALAAEKRYLSGLRQGRQERMDRGKRTHDSRAIEGPSRQIPICFNCGRRGHRHNVCRAPTVGRQDVTCWNCGEKGHMSHRCPKEQLPRDVRPAVTCWRCGETGHVANQCTHPPAQRPRPAAVQGPPKRLAIDQAPRQQAPAGRVYALDTDRPGPSRPPQGPIAGMYGF